ncbi:MFS transporter [Pseudonocardia sp. CA-107938]|uniref:MFS transporter n=1 Tax=Pseudonocardia sp. CA-107938 TaxID=3240021 RepID=UPI003D94A4D5
MVAPDRYRWVVLAVGATAQGTTAAFFMGLASVTPALRAHYGLDLAGVGALIGAISVGLVATMIPWGGAADRFGERGVMTVGLLGSAAALAAAAVVPGPVAAGLLLALAGASGASVNAASGRAVLTWFPAELRGFAMAVRQTAVPAGAAVAAVVLPGLAGSAGIPAVLAALSGASLVMAGAVAVWVREPPDRPARGTTARTGFRAVLADKRLQRLSAAGFALVVPQYLGVTFLVEMLHDGSGLPLAVAGALLAGTQVLSAAGRIGVGAWSDRVASRLGPLRILAVAVAVGFATSAALEPGPATLLAAVLVPAVALAACWNGLVFTAAGELAPAGRAATGMAVTNTANFLSAAITPVVGGAVAQVAGWPAMLALGAVAAVFARVALAGLGPDQDERSRAATPAQNS